MLLRASKPRAATAPEPPALPGDGSDARLASDGTVTRSQPIPGLTVDVVNAPERRSCSQESSYKSRFLKCSDITTAIGRFHRVPRQSRGL